MSDVCVCICIHGDPNYFRMGEEAISSVLDHSDFDIFVFVGPGPRLHTPSSARVTYQSYEGIPRQTHRAKRFLVKFNALQYVLDNTDYAWFMMLDADAVFAHTITRESMEKDLQGRALGMAEQTTITGSNMTRRDFLDHYIKHSLAWLSP
ncbi:MAG: hypothetical protein P8X90_33740, partial [Desulfobacterales bacterium]